MTNQLATARAAIAAEIKSLAAEQAKLEKVLAQLDGRSSGAPTAASTVKGKRGRGRPRKVDKAAASAGDLDSALKIIEEAGKKGVKAIRLAFLIKSAGGTKPDKASLLETGKVKMTGKGGGSTYVFID